MSDARRITLINQPALRVGNGREWNATRDSSSRIVFVPSFTVLRYAIENAVASLAHDVERVVIDRTATAAEYLELIATLPAEFGGDLMFIRADATGFLSSRGRGGDRVMYLLDVHDVDFYLNTHDLVCEQAVRKSA
jgi:hypothetical protein